MKETFREMASKARAAHQELIEEEQGRRTAEREARSKAIDAGVASLKQYVLPLLESARQAFEEEGVDAKITEEFDVKDRLNVNPSMSFRCLGPKRATDGWQFEAAPVFFASDGMNVDVGAGARGYSKRPDQKLGTAPVGECEPLVSEALQKAITAYYDELQSH